MLLIHVIRHPAVQTQFVMMGCVHVCQNIMVILTSNVDQNVL